MISEEMSAISRTAKSMEYAFDGISNKFPRNMPDANMLAKARAFEIEAALYAADFKDYGLPGTFIADLTSCSSPARGGVAASHRRGGGSAFEATFTTTASATAEHVAATADTSGKIREGMVIVRTLDGIVKNKYANDPGKLAAWVSASHVEKAPKKKDPTP